MQRALKGILIALIAEYVLGMYVAMFSLRPEEPGYATEPVINKIIFGIHGLLGLGLLIGATVLLVQGIKNKNSLTKSMTIYGFLSILLAFAAGIATVILKKTASETVSFIMSIGFILSLIFYGRLFFSSKKINHGKTVNH